MADKIITLQDLAKIGLDDREVYIDGLLYAGQMVGFVGAQKTGKSYMLDQLLLYLSEGKNWGEDRLYIPKPRSVLLYQTEGSEYDLAERVNATRSILDSKGLNWAAVIPEEFDLKTGLGINTLDKQIKELDIEVLGIDSLYTSMSGSTSNETDINAVFMNLRKLQVKYRKLSIIFIHHEHRAKRDFEGNMYEDVKDRYSGTWMIMAKVDISWHLVKDSNQYSEKREFSTENARMRIAGIDPFNIEMNYDTGILKAEEYQITDGIQQLRFFVKGQGFVSNHDWTEWFKEKKYARSSGYRWRLIMEDKGEIKKATRLTEDGKTIRGWEWNR